MPTEHERRHSELKDGGRTIPREIEFILEIRKYKFELCMSNTIKLSHRQHILHVSFFSLLYNFLLAWQWLLLLLLQQRYIFH